MAKRALITGIAGQDGSYLSELLLSKGLITEDELNLCVETKRLNPHKRIGNIFKHYNLIDDQTVTEIESEQINWPIFNDEYIPNYDLLSRPCTHSPSCFEVRIHRSPN